MNREEVNEVSLFKKMVFLFVPFLFLCFFWQFSPKVLTGLPYLRLDLGGVRKSCVAGSLLAGCGAPDRGPLVDTLEPPSSLLEREPP